MVRFKGLFCSFCLEDGADRTISETTFNRSIDVSHLATPHITSSPSIIVDRSLTPLQATNNEDPPDDKYNNFNHQAQHKQNNAQSDSNLSSNNTEDDRTSFVRPQSRLHLELSSSSQPSSSSPPFAPSSPVNLYDPPNDAHHHHEQQGSIQNHQSHQRQPPPPPREHPSPSISQPQPPQPASTVPPPPPPPPVVSRNSPPSTSNGTTGTTTKLSYDIISVREPLAKILAERQQLLQTQQQQRQVLGDHEYIEVYGERGSSCFYEEIAGSVTSSATYDQIGANSNHNYQVLINAYAVANRQPAANHNDREIVNHNNNNNNNDNTAPCNGSSREINQPSNMDNNTQQEENAYDVTSHPSDIVDGPSTSSAFAVHSAPTQHPMIPTPNQPETSDASPSITETSLLAQSIPVYSVINKATRRGNSIMRSAFEDTSRPPKPPPKNLFVSHQQPSTSAISTYNDASISNISQHVRAWSPIPQVPSTSSYFDSKHSNNESGESPKGKHRNDRLPQPPPRYSKHSAFNYALDRPLPSPNSNLDNLNNNNNNNQTLNQNVLTQDDDIESNNNGYELLRSNLEDDQIDVGYEKIRESNRYSGGSISSQFYSRQFLDNGGYESVQPIYSSPSNCYEVLNPATASEIAAAAAAKLNVIEKFLKKD